MGTGGAFLRRLRAKVFDEPTGFWWVYRGRLAASGFPSSRDQVRWLSRKGVKSILTLTEAPLPQEWVEGTGMSVKNLPMRDHEPPAAGALAEAADYIERELASGRVLLVHCLAGSGRTGCALAAYLMKKDGMSADQAIRLVRKKRSGSIEHGQEGALHEFEAMYMK